MSENMQHMESIAKAIFESNALRQLDWLQSSIVFEMDDDGYVVGTYGFAYDEHGKSIPVAPSIDEIEEPVQAYREWLRLDGDKGFIKMLFQFDRTNSKVNASFEFENPQRWSVTPANIDKITEELRPRLDN